MKLVDTHCHLDGEPYAADRDAVIERALARGVAHMVAIGTGEGPPDLEAGLRLAARYPALSATVGVQPHDASKADEAALRRVEQLAAESPAWAVGEIGLDYHYNFSPPEVQRAVFTRQLVIASAASRPVIIHTREAWTDTVALIRKHFRGPGGIFHCFSEGPEEAAEALELGFHLAFGGVITFPSAHRVRAAALAMPVDRLLLETDAPYLAPVPHRGKRNEPAFLVATLEKLAQIRGEEPEALASATTANFVRLSGRAL